MIEVGKNRMEDHRDADQSISIDICKTNLPPRRTAEGCANQAIFYYNNLRLPAAARQAARFCWIRGRNDARNARTPLDTRQTKLLCDKARAYYRVSWSSSRLEIVSPKQF
jgi:hypothetical protein